MRGYDVASLVKELLQNSDDAGASTVVVIFDYQQNTLRWIQDVALTGENFDALGCFHQATKRNDPTSTGEFGVGFASVFHVTNTPEVISNRQRWQMDLETLAITQGNLQKALLNEYADLFERLQISADEAKAMFSFPFRREQTLVHTARFSPCQLADVDKKVTAAFQSPSMLFFLANLKKLRLIRVGVDGTVAAELGCSVQSQLLCERKHSLGKTLTTPNAQLPPQSFSDVQVTIGNERAATWRYASRVDRTPGDIRPIVLQLASPAAEGCAAGEVTVFAVGLPLTACPLLCHASATLEVDSTRTAVTDSIRNKTVLAALANLYCNDILPYVMHTDRWPLRDYQPRGTLQHLVTFVLKTLANGVNGVTFPVRDAEPDAFPTSIKVLCVCPDGAPHNVTATYQHIMLQGTHTNSSLAAKPHLITRLSKDAVDAFRSVLPSEVLPSWTALLCAKNLQELNNDACWDQTSVAQRCELLRFLLENTESSKRLVALGGLPLCERHTDPCLGDVHTWVRFPQAQESASRPVVFYFDEFSTSLLVNRTHDIVMSEAATQVFALFPTLSIAAPLTLAHLLDCNSAVLRRQLSWLDEHCASERDREAFLISFWKLVARHPNSHLTSHQESALRPLPLLWRMAPLLNSAEDRAVVQSLPLQCTSKSAQRHVCCDRMGTCIVVSMATVQPLYLQTFLSLLEALGVPLIDPAIAAGVTKLPCSKTSNATNLRHMVALLQDKLPLNAGALVSDRVLWCLELPEILEALRSDAELRSIVMKLPVFVQLGDRSARRGLVDATTGKASGLVVESEVFRDLPSSVHTSSVMLSVPQRLASALHLAPTSAEHVAVEQLKEGVWCAHTHADRLHFIRWMEAKGFRTLLPTVLVPTCKSVNAETRTAVWAPVSTVMRSTGRSASSEAMHAFVGLVKRHAPEAFPRMETSEDRDLIGDPALALYYQQELTLELLLSASRAIPRPKTVTMEVPSNCKADDVWRFIEELDDANGATGDVRAFLDAARFYMTTVEAVLSQLVEDMNAQNENWVPCVQRVKMVLEDPSQPPSNIKIALSFQSVRSIGCRRFFDYMEGDAVWLELALPGTPLSKWSMTKAYALTALAERWRTVAFYARGGDDEARRLTCFHIQAAIEDTLETGGVASRPSSLNLCEGHLTPAEVRKALQPLVEQRQPFISDVNAHQRSKWRLCLPEECSASSRFDPFVPQLSEFWLCVFEIAPTSTAPKDVATFISRLSWWNRKSLEVRDVPVYKEYLRQVLQPLIQDAMSAVSPKDQKATLRSLRKIVLPNVALMMRKAADLCYVYSTTGIRDDVAQDLSGVILYSELSPETFDFGSFRLLGVRNIRSGMEQQIIAVPCTDELPNCLSQRLTRIVASPHFSELLQIACGTPQQGTGRANQLLQRVSLTLCSSLRVRWTHECIRTDDHSVQLEPEYALTPPDADTDETAFFVLAGTFNGMLDDELIRRGVVSCLCEVLFLPSTTRRDDLSIALRCPTEEALASFVAGKRPVRVNGEHQPSDVEAQYVPPPMNVPPPVTVPSTRRPQEGDGRTASWKDASNDHGIPDDGDDGESVKCPPLYIRSDEPPVHGGGFAPPLPRQGPKFKRPRTSPVPRASQRNWPGVAERQGDVFDLEEPSSFYQHKSVSRPTEITTNKPPISGDPSASLTTRSDDDVDDVACCSPPMTLKQTGLTAPNGCPLYSDGSWEKATLTVQQAVLRGLEGLATVLYDAAERIDPAAAAHCIIIYTSIETGVLAFNKGGVLAFDVMYYIRDPSPYDWTVVFIHEYSHNNTIGHELCFRKKLQYHCARYIELALSSGAVQPTATARSLVATPPVPTAGVPSGSRSFQRSFSQAQSLEQSWSE